MAGRQAQGEQCHYRQQFPHGAVPFAGCVWSQPRCGAWVPLPAGERAPAIAPAKLPVSSIADALAPSPARAPRPGRVTGESNRGRLLGHGLRRHAAAMFVVTEAKAAAIRVVFEHHGELSAAIELRRLFPGVTDNVQAREVSPWAPGSCRWLAERRSIGPVAAVPLFRRTGVSLARR